MGICTKRFHVKQVILVLGILLSLLFLCLGFFIVRNNHPKVMVSVKLVNVPSEEYENRIQFNVNNPNNIRKIEVEVKVNNSKSCEKRDIYITELDLVDHYDKVRSLFAGSSEINNIRTDSTASASKYIVFDSTGLALADLKKIYKDAVVTVDLLTKNNQNKTYQFNIGELLQE